MGDGRMEGREGMEAEGEQDARCEVWDWLEEGRGAMEDREKLLEARKETWLCRDPEAYARLHSDRRRTARDLDDNNCEDISRQQEWQIKTTLPCFAPFLLPARYLQRVSSRTELKIQRRLIL